MGNCEAVATESTSTGRWKGPAKSCRSRDPERHPLDPADGSHVARSTRPISAIPDVPSTIPGMGVRRGLRESPEGAGHGCEGARQAGSHRMFHRWHLRHRKKGGRGVGKTKRGKGTKLMAVADRSGLPIAISAQSASPHEVRLVESTLQSRFTREYPQRLIGDRAYDSDPLDERLRRRGIELIAPHKSNRKRPPTQDGRPLRRYHRRWKIERLFAWLQNFRRIQTRHERYLENYLAFVLLGCIVIFFRTCF